MRDILKLGFVLFLVCLGAALCLSLTYVFTEGRIEAMELSEIEGSLKEVMPDAQGGFEKITKDDFGYYKAYKDEQRKDISGYVIIATGKGYGGAVATMVGVDTAGVIKIIKILEQKETPGLGAKISEESFKSQFSGQDGRKPNIMAISGATISSRAVTESVKKTVERLFEILGDGR
ncbi:MAG: FMN-binding protein [Candidatus Omnitrophica bacterium]|nr:FMN-binding protein [Candidatus Omnitrophota bacterium]